MAGVKSKSVVSSKPTSKYSSYTEVSKLSANELKAVCVRYHISNTLPRCARVIFLCHFLGISTVGRTNDTGGIRKQAAEKLSPQQVEELKKLTPVYLLRQITWTKDISSLPDVDESVVKSYLLDAHLVDVNSVKRYKLSRAFQLKQFVHTVSVSNCQAFPSFFCVQARCNPSQSSQADDVKVVFIVLDQVTGDPCSAYCTCTVGFSQACGHIGAVLFVLADWISSGLQTVPELAACTDTLCGWINPKGAAVKAKRFHDIGQEQSTAKRRRTAMDYGDFIKDQTSTRDLPSYEDVLTLRADLIAATITKGWIPPAVWCLDPSRFRRNEPPVHQPPPPLIFTLPDQLPELSPHLAYSTEMTIITKPLPIAFLPHKTFTDATASEFNNERDRFLSSFTYSPHDLQEVTKLTAGQSTNLEWFEQKYGSLTSSNFSRILRYISTRKADPDKIVSDVMGYKKRENPTKRPTVPSLKYGLRYEAVARMRYLKRFESTHQHLRVEETGLHVCAEFHFLRASPDGVVTCACHPVRLIEIKCPYTARDVSVRQGVRDKKIDYLTMASDFSLHLKTGGDYYHQMQGAMAITGIHQSELVVYTKKTLEVIPVSFDAQMWTSTQRDLCEFFEIHVVPEILTERVKQGHTPAKTLTNSDTNSVTPTPCDITKCHLCGVHLPEPEDIKPDNSDACVACECEDCNCTNEDKWYCWPCVGFTAAMSNAGDKWFCEPCRTVCRN